MNSITLLSPAKLNLTLDVVGTRPDGYHEIESIMQPVNLFDVVRIKLAEGEGIGIEAKGLSVPQGEDNLAWKAANVFLQESRLRSKVNIFIEKRIPLGAGLGGGSGNAAAVLVGMNRIAKRFSEDDLITLSPRIGADVAFFIQSRTALIRGIGERVTFIRDFPLFHYVLLNPEFQVSTKRIYELWDEMGKKGSKTGVTLSDSGRAPQGKAESAISLFREGIFPIRNDLEKPALALYPEIQSMKERLLSMGVEAVLMTGSGPTVFGAFGDRKVANTVYEYLRDGDKFKVFLVQGISGWHRL